MIKKLSAIVLAFICAVASYAQTGQGATLKFNPENGSNYVVNMNTTSNVIQNMMGQEMKITVISNVASLYNVQDAGENKEIKVTYESLKVQTEIMGQYMQMDSEDPDTTNQQNKLLRSLKGAYFVAVINPSGKLISIKENTLESKTAGLSGMEKQMLKGMLGEEAIKTTMEQGFNIYPDKASVKAGDAWTNTTSMEVPYKMTGTTTYTLDKIENNKAFVNYTNNLSTNGSQKMTMNGMEMNVTVTGTGKGNMELDVSTGMPMLVTLTQTVKGNMEIMNQTVPLTMVSDIKTTVIKK